MRAESLRDEQTRLIREIAERSQRLHYITELIESRWERQARVLPLPVTPVQHVQDQAGNVSANGRRKVTQK